MNITLGLNGDERCSKKTPINVETVQNLPLIPKTTPDGENPILFPRVH